jgi:hypothetical protein
MMSVSAFTMPPEARPIAYGLGIYQNWHMFAPPSHTTTWYIMTGTLRNGQQIEMLRPIIWNDMTLVEPIDLKQTENIGPGYYKNVRWRLYFSRLGSEQMKPLRFAFANYVCRTWNAYHTGSMEVVSLYYVHVVQPILPAGERGEQREQRFGPYSCS